MLLDISCHSEIFDHFLSVCIPNCGSKLCVALVRE
jgi:hypothetical protein